MKEYRYVPPPAAKDEKPDELGLTPSMIDFDWERDVEPQSQPIQWKSDAVNLSKLHPRILSDDDEEDVADIGSFFNFFTEKKDPLEVRGRIWRGEVVNAGVSDICIMLFLY